MKNIRIEIKWALVFSVMLLSWTLLERLLGFHSTRIAQQNSFGTLVLIPSTTTYVLALINKKRDFYGRTASFQQLMKSGTILTLLILLLTPVYHLLTTTLISPDFFSNAQEYAVSSGAMSREEAMSQLNAGTYLLISLIAGLIMGLFFTALIALILKSRKRLAKA